MRNTNEPVRGRAEKDTKADKAERLAERAEAAQEAAIACADSADMPSTRKKVSGLVSKSR